MLPVRLALAVINPELRGEVASALAELPAKLVADCREHSCWQDFLERLAQVQPHIVVLDLTSLPVPLDEAVGSIRLAASAAVAALSTGADSESILRAVRAGVNEYLYPPVRFALRKMLERKSQELHFAGAPRTRGKVLGFLSAKGGCGATTIACRIAAELGKHSLPRGGRALLADLDLDAGVAALVMKAEGRYSALDALESLYRMDPDRWREIVVPAGDGLEVLPAPPLCAPRDAFSTARLNELVEFIRTLYGWTVADLGRGWSAVAFDLLEAVDETFLVFTPEVPALHQTRQLVEMLLRRGVAEQKLRLVLNQASSEMDLTLGEIETIMSLPVFAAVRATDACREDLLVPADALGRQLQELAARAGE